MRLDLTHDLDKLAAQMQKAARAAPSAAKEALNDIAFMARRELQAEMRKRFDNPTPYILKSTTVKKAEQSRLEAFVGPEYMGGKGVDPSNILGPEVLGGPRRTKRFERALQAKGWLAPGMQVSPGAAAPRDSYGNVPPAFLVLLLSYLQAFGEQGYRANMRAKKKAAIEQRQVSRSGYKTISGVAFFISRGRGNWFGARSWQRGRTQNLPPGIWAKSGTHGSKVECVFHFIRPAMYTARYDPEAVAIQLVNTEAESVIRKRLEQAMRL